MYVCIVCIVGILLVVHRNPQYTITSLSVILTSRFLTKMNRIQGLPSSCSCQRFFCRHVLVVVSTLRPCSMHILRRRKLLLVSSKKTGSRLVLCVFRAPEPTLLSRRNSENVQNSTADKKWAIFRWFQFFSNSTGSWVESDSDWALWTRLLT